MMLDHSILTKLRNSRVPYETDELQYAFRDDATAAQVEQALAEMQAEGRVVWDDGWRAVSQEAKQASLF